MTVKAVLLKSVAVAAMAAAALPCLAQLHLHLGLRHILLIPLDDRPATTQYVQWIGDMAGVQVDTPPHDLLGRFTTPGRPEGVLDWMSKQRLGKYDAVLLSTDMVAYGGLVASRTDRTSLNLARKRLKALWKVRNQFPRVPFYAFSGIMRVTPTATLQAEPWRLLLAQYEEAKEKAGATPSQDQSQLMARLATEVGRDKLIRYDGIRSRDFSIQQDLLRMVKHGAFNYLVLGQDDAEKHGPHVPETTALMKQIQSQGISEKVAYVQGVDQIASCLLSRALTTMVKWAPHIKVILADEQGRSKIASYESQPVGQSLRDQIALSGADASGASGDFDYTLYVNTPQPRAQQFRGFLQSLETELDQHMPVAVADINLSYAGSGDPELFDDLLEADRAARLLGYAGWNTAGNTMGTAIPAANVYLIGRRLGVDPLARELALRRFLLHRLVADFQYHMFVRPEAYHIIAMTQPECRDEVYGATFDQVRAFVVDDLTRRLGKIFDEEIKGKPFFAGDRKYEVSSLEDVKVDLPWPRAYEASLDFKLRAEQAP